MPILTLPLFQDGPLLDFYVGVSQPRAQQLQAAGRPLPAAVVVRVLLDTGASCSCLDPAVLGMLNLTPTGSVFMNTPSTGTIPHRANQYDVSLTLVHPTIGLTFAAVPVIEAHRATQGIQGLIGRDILANCLFIYNGLDGNFVLGF